MSAPSASVAVAAPTGVPSPVQHLGVCLAACLKVVRVRREWVRGEAGEGEGVVLWVGVEHLFPCSRLLLVPFGLSFSSAAGH